MSPDVEFYKRLSAAAAKLAHDHFSDLFRSRQRELLLTSIATFLFSVGIFKSTETRTVDFGFIEFELAAQKWVIILGLALCAYCLIVFILTTYQVLKRLSHERVAVAAELDTLVKAQDKKREAFEQKVIRQRELAVQHAGMIVAAQKLEGEARGRAFADVNEFSRNSGLEKLSVELSNNDALLAESGAIVRVLDTMKRLDRLQRMVEIWFPIIVAALAIIAAIRFLTQN